MSTIRLVASDPPTMLIDLEENAPVDANCCCRLCPHDLYFSITFDETDISNKDIIEFIDEPNESNGIGIYSYDNSDGTHAIGAYSWAEGGEVDIFIPNDQFFNTLLNVSCKFSRIDGITTNVEFSVDGFGSGSFTTDASYAQLNSLYVGAVDGGGDGAHRTIQSISAIANPASLEASFNFPNDSFDSFVGGASIVDTALRIDTDSGQAYALKTLDPGQNLGCSFCIPDVQPFNLLLTTSADWGDLGVCTSVISLDADATNLPNWQCGTQHDNTPYWQPSFSAGWNSYWGGPPNDDTGEWCEDNSNNTEGGLWAIMSLSDTACNPTGGCDDNKQAIHSAWLRYGIINGEGPGWHVLLRGFYSLDGGSTEHSTGAFNHFLGDTINGDFTMTLDNFTFNWLFSQ